MKRVNLGQAREANMYCRDWISIIAILSSPAIAMGVSLWFQDRRDKLQQKRFLFTSLMATRHHIISEEMVRALNMIDVVFHDNDRVRQLWREYLGMLNNQGLNNEQGYKQRDKKRLELIQEIATAVGYGKEISHLNVDDFYLPVGLAKERERAKEIGDELLRVLKETGGIKLVQKDQPAKEGSQTT
jgi:hypothetical protein